jgi:hypothetical protein
MSPETITAVDGARAGHDQEHPAAVFLQQARSERRGSVADRVGHEPGYVVHLVRNWQNLPQERVARVAGVHTGGKSPGGEERKTFTSQAGTGSELARQNEQFA